MPQNLKNTLRRRVHLRMSARVPQGRMSCSDNRKGSHFLIGTLLGLWHAHILRRSSMSRNSRGQERRQTSMQAGLGSNVGGRPLAR